MPTASEESNKLSNQKSPPRAEANLFQRFHARHEQLKTFVHEGMRVPLPRWGRFLMGVVYFSVPVVGGLSIMNWSIGKAHESIGPNGERLSEVSSVVIANNEGMLQRNTNGGSDSPSLVGNKAVVGETERQIGAGGWGGGVRLSVSDTETQRNNRQALHQFFAAEKKKRRRQQHGNNQERPADSGTRSEVQASD